MSSLSLCGTPNNQPESLPARDSDSLPNCIAQCGKRRNSLVYSQRIHRYDTGYTVLRYGRPSMETVSSNGRTPRSPRSSWCGTVCSLVRIRPPYVMGWSSPGNRLSDNQHTPWASPQTDYSYGTHYRPLLRVLPSVESQTPNGRPSHSAMSLCCGKDCKLSRTQPAHAADSS